MDEPEQGRPGGLAVRQVLHKGQSMGTGQAPVKRYNRQLRDLIISGPARPSFIVCHEIGLDAAPDAYDKFDRRVDGYIRVLLKPHG